MAPYSDPQMEQLMDLYFDNDGDPQYLYRGSQESITEELKAWVVRSKEVYKEQIELRHGLQKSTMEGLSSPGKMREPGAISAALSRHARVKVGKICTKFSGGTDLDYVGH